MRRIIIIAATLLVSTPGAQAASQKALHHPTHRQAKNISACIASQRADADLFAALGKMAATDP